MVCVATAVKIDAARSGLAAPSLISGCRSVREHAATRRDRVQGLVVLGVIVEAGGVGVEQRGHLVDECAGAARARTVHALFGSGLQVRDLGVLAAELDDDVGLRVFLVDRAGLGDDLLDERHVQVVGERQAAGTGDGETNGLVAAAEVDERLMDVLSSPATVARTLAW